MARKQWVQSIVLIFTGALMFAITYSIFLEPSHITGGGLSGVALIIYRILKFPPGVVTFILNIPLFIFAFKDVGRRYFILSIIGVIFYTGFIELTMYFQTELLNLFGNPQHDIMLSTICAGLLGGFGMGLVIRAGGSTGGSDLLAGLVNRKRPNVSIGQVIMAFDLTVVLANSIVENDFSVALYSIITIILVTVVIDFFVDGFKECRAYYVISEKHEEISIEVLNKLHRGATAIGARGMYTKKEKNMILVLIKKRQQTELRNIIKRIDPKAFIFAVSAKEVLGEGFNPLDPKEKVLTKGVKINDNNDNAGNH